MENNNIENNNIKNNNMENKDPNFSCFEKALDNIIDENLWDKCFKYKKYLPYVILGSTVSYFGYKYGIVKFNDLWRKE